jgi:hypothetical protein
MADQWVDPRKARSQGAGTRRGLTPAARGARKTTTRRGGGVDGEGEDGERGLPPRRSNTALIVGVAGGGALLLVLAVVAMSSGGSKRPAPMGRSNEYGYNNPMTPELQASSKPVGYVPPPNISTKDCGSIRGICKACEYETDIGNCVNEACRARNLFFQHSETYKFLCFRCGTESPPIKCEQCGGSLYKPKTKAR